MGVMSEMFWFRLLIILCMNLGDLASDSAGNTSIRRITPPSGRIFLGDRRTLALGPPPKKLGTVASKSWVTRYLAPLLYSSSVTSFQPSSTSFSWNPKTRSATREKNFGLGARSRNRIVPVYIRLFHWQTSYKWTCAHSHNTRARDSQLCRSLTGLIIH